LKIGSSRAPPVMTDFRCDMSRVRIGFSTYKEAVIRLCGTMSVTRCTAVVEDNHADDLEMTIVVDPLLLLPYARLSGSPHNLHPPAAPWETQPGIRRPVC
jgi:hypothetical protein